MILNSSVAAVVTGGASGLGAATARALAMIENSCFNGKDVRLDGAIRMPPK